MEVENRIEILEKKVDEIVARLDTVLGKETLLKTYSDKSAKDESAREFFLKFNPKNDTVKTLVAIKFLEKNGVQSITIREIADTFKEMREPVPTNISDKIQLLDKRGLVKIAGQEGKRKRWLISNTGEDYLGRLYEDAK